MRILARHRCFDKASAYGGANAIYALAKRTVQRMERGVDYEIHFVVINPVYRHQLRKLYHGVVLKQIAEQYRPDGRIWSIAAWKEFFRDWFCPDQSTEDLYDDDFAELVLQVMAFACMEMNVVFTEEDHE